MKNKKYSHIKKAERLEIAILLDKGYSYRNIAKSQKRSVSSVSEEISNNSVNGKYDPQKADHKAYVKRKYSKYQGMKVVSDLRLWNYIEDKIKEDWSPEEISGRIENINTQIKPISAKGIYKFIYSVYGRNLEKFLAYKGKKKKPRTASKTEQLKDRVFIDKRPKIIEKRRRFGDWEGDFIVSGKNGKGVILTLYERKSKYCILKKFLVQRTELIHQYIFEITGGVVMNSLTLDNDIVFKKHRELSELLGRPIYFCHPYHSWEKGGVENINKLIRRYIPKGSDISQYSDEYIKTIQDKLNNRPRKCLKYKTPFEVMRENNQFKKEIKYLLSDTLKVEENTKAKCSA
ncbi:MAG: IS30 family transposase [bacterium]|nr:IS30 family transposase [bacterium]